MNNISFKHASCSLNASQKARDVIKKTCRSIELLSEFIDDHFDKAIDLLASLSHHVVVTGMGKSGHVGRKIAATFASTGQPAFFVHPSEASHGDLGMITKKNGILFLSNGGETEELSFILQYKERFSIPSIAITANPNSTLGRNVDVCLCIPKIEEICPLGLAPTTSTTLMMILGDALAVTLLEKRSFTSDDFYQFHPGGHLGKQLSYVKNYMHAPPIWVGNSKVVDALDTMSAYSFGCLAVCDEKRHLLGVITDGDIRRHANSLLNTLTYDVMTKKPITISSGALMAQALNIMQEKKITSLLVVDDQKLVGIIHIHDCLQNKIV